MSDIDPARGKRFLTACEYLYGKGVTRVALARAFGCSESAVRGWIGGFPLNGMLVKLLAEKGIAENYLLHGMGGMVVDRAQPKELAPALRDHLILLKELMGVLHDYELDAVRGVIALDEFGEVVRAAAKAVAEVGKKTAKNKGKNCAG